MKSARPTINDVARQAGVSKATVSAVLNDAGSVKASTRDRITAAMEMLNYRPTRLAGRGTAARKGRIDGVRRACSGSHLIFGDQDVVPAGAHLEDGYRLLPS